MTLLYDWLKKAAKVQGNNKAVVYRDNYLSWRGLLHRVDRRAQEFKSMGIKEGAWVGLMLGNVPDIVILALALSKLDAPLASKTLKTAKVELTPLSREGYEQANAAQDITNEGWTIEHAFVTRADQYPRMKALNLFIDMVALLDTLVAWFACEGSAQRAGQRLYCHRNTVLNRLRRCDPVTSRTSQTSWASAATTLGRVPPCTTPTLTVLPRSRSVRAIASA